MKDLNEMQTETKGILSVIRKQLGIQVLLSKASE